MRVGVTEISPEGRKFAGPSLLWSIDLLQVLFHLALHVTNEWMRNNGV